MVSEGIDSPVRYCKAAGPETKVPKHTMQEQSFVDLMGNAWVQRPLVSHPCLRPNTAELRPVLSRSPVLRGWVLVVAVWLLESFLGGWILKIMWRKSGVQQVKPLSIYHI